MEPAHVNDPLTAAVASSIVTAILLWLSGKGWPVIKEALGLMGQKEKEIRDQAKEGPIMVLEEVKRQLAETKAQAIADKLDQTTKLTEVLLELKEIRKAHHDCETKHAALQAEVGYLRTEIQQLREQGGSTG